MLRAIGLSKRYRDAPRAALDSLDLDVHDGEILFLLGANGAGKTTTLNCFLDFTTPTGGHAEVDGVTVAHQPLEAKRRLALLSENVAVYGTLTTRQNLRFLARLGGEKLDLSTSATNAALANVGLPPATFDSPARDLSKGMRQKLALAVALARDTPNLLLDEPTSGLDPAAADYFMHRLAALGRNGRRRPKMGHHVQ